MKCRICSSGIEIPMGSNGWLTITETANGSQSNRKSPFYVTESTNNNRFERKTVLDCSWKRDRPKRKQNEAKALAQEVWNLNVHVVHHPKCLLTKLQQARMKTSIPCMIQTTRARVKSHQSETKSMSNPRGRNRTSRHVEQDQAIYHNHVHIWSSTASKAFISIYYNILRTISNTDLPGIQFWHS